ncbi:ribosome-associated translation inhibitor RaiA [Flavobacteriaceae bacterium]|nr:ribosome-associated translation inhibitor RaiA [Flavobacteriaceae bacterium]
MKVTIQSPQHSVSLKLNNFIQKKLNKLELFYDRIIRAEVFLKVVNSSEKSNKISEILLHLPGEQLVIKKEAASFEAAIDLSVHSLERGLKKTKAKQRAFI